MAHQSNYKPNSGFEKWMDERLPIIRLGYDSFVDFPSPKNLNYWWTFGAILAIFLVIQIITGVVLAMSYTPHVDLAFNSVEHIRRDVNWGRYIQAAHANGLHSSSLQYMSTFSVVCITDHIKHLVKCFGFWA